MYCPKCGKNLPDSIRFCTECGTPLLNPEYDTDVNLTYVTYDPRMINVPQVNSSQAFYIYNNFLSKMENLASAWMVIAVIQLIIGILTIIYGIGIIKIILGIWNISQSNKIRNAARYFRQTPIGIVRYVDELSSGILCLIINIMIGGLPGIIGAAMGIMTNSYGKDNRQAMYVVEFGGGKS